MKLIIVAKGSMYLSASFWLMLSVGGLILRLVTGFDVMSEGSTGRLVSAGLFLGVFVAGLVWLVCEAVEGWRGKTP